MIDEPTLFDPDNINKQSKTTDPFTSHEASKAADVMVMGLNPSDKTFLAEVEL